jgi:hypothetical protein
MDLENRSAFGRFCGVVDIDFVDIANDPRAKSRQPSLRSEDVTDEFNCFQREPIPEHG